MKPPGLIEKIDDAINPIVVKELRQAVHSRFVVTVVLAFLLMQLVYLGIHLTFVGMTGQLEIVDYQAGRDVFSWLQGILLATCMLFLPAYTGARLAAELSEVNTDLLFITTLQPRKIISGKLASAVVIAVMIISACAPFMAFTYFLRGIDLTSIFFFVLIDFLVVIGSVHLMVLLAVVPSNRVLKAFLGVIGFGSLVGIFISVLASSIFFIQTGFSPDFDDRLFVATAATIAVGFLGYCGLLYAWSVALISAPSANRVLPMRVFLLAFTIVSGVVLALLSYQFRAHEQEPFGCWVLGLGLVIIISVLIAINERQSWTPRVSRTIPRNLLLRVPAFLFYSGAAGGLLFAMLLAGVGALGYWLFGLGVPATNPTVWTIFQCIGILALYVYCYGLTAVFVRTWLAPGLQPTLTWTIAILLLAVGSLVPLLISALLYLGRWNYNEQYYWLLGNPVAAAVEMGHTSLTEQKQAFLYFSALWAVAMTLLNARWFGRQIIGFRPYDPSGAVAVPIASSSDSSSATLPVSR